MEGKYELHPELMNNESPARIRFSRQENNGYLHWHESLELLYFTQGSCKVINGNEELSVQAGDIAVINSGTLHYVKAKGTPCAYILLQLDPVYFETMGFPVRDSAIQKTIRDPEICEILKKALSEQEKEQPYYRQIMKAMMVQLLSLLFRNYLAADFYNSDRSCKSKLIKKVAAYIEQHYHEELTVETVSRACGYSRFYIAKTFKEVTGYTVIWYINATRIQQAKALMKTGNLSVSEIAIRCGFANLSYFSKVFKRLEKQSPQEFKAALGK